MRSDRQSVISRRFKKGADSGSILDMIDKNKYESGAQKKLNQIV